MPLPDYYSRVNPDLLSLIPPNAKTVLEIGCGAGALCAEYRKRNPEVRWIGVELEEDAWTPAESNGVSLICGDVTRYDWWELAPNGTAGPGVDCLVLGDVLEHLPDPWRTLFDLAYCCRPGAQVLASIPNVQHWTVIRDLLNGKWDYQDEGLMDRTHLRFFTLKSIREMFAEAKLHVFEIRGRDLCNQGYEAWLVESGVKPRKEMRAYQYIVRAVKPTISLKGEDGRILKNGDVIINENISWYKEPVKPLHIHAVTAEECCARPRILEPLDMMITEPGVTCSFGAAPTAKTPNKILIRQRNFRMETDRIRQLVSDGWLIIQECDDYPLAYQNGEANNWSTFRECHAIQVSTEPIAEIVRRWNPNVMVFPNQIAELPVFEPHDHGDRVAIFYGAQNRDDDWKLIMPAINRLIAEFGDRLEFRVIHDKGFHDCLNTTQKGFDPFYGYAKYRAILRSCDIALLPLEDTQFNRCKSDLKFLECAAEGVLAIAGPVIYEHLCNIDQVTCSPKDDRLKNGVYVFGYNNAPSFERSLRSAIEHADYRRETAETAYYYVSRYRLLSQHYRTQLDWYRSLLRSKEALHRDLLARVPALGGSPRSAP